MRESKIEALRAAKARQHDVARPDAVATVHAGGKLTARERITLLLDADSAVEYGSIAAYDPEGMNDGWVAEAGGVDFVGRIGGQTVIASSTDYTDRGGGYGAARIERLMGLAEEHRWPIVFFVDGGGSRARHPRVGLGHVETSGPIGRFQLFDGMAELSGWVPTVAIVSGPSFAGHASLAGFSDCVISTPGSSIGMGGPPMVEAALGITLTPNELAGSEMHDVGGGIDLLVADEHEAIAAAQRYISFFAPDGGTGVANSDADSIASLIPDDGPYDVTPVIEALIDDRTFIELRPAFGRSVVTGFARVGGRSAGILASQPAADDGLIDEAAAVKINRFVELCDSYDFPIVSLIDSLGTVTTWPDPDPDADEGATVAEPGVNRWHTRAIVAHQHRTVPTVAIQMRRADGLSHHLMAGSPNARAIPLQHLAWPSVEIGHTDGYSSTRNVNAFDDIVDPRETRQRLVRLLGHLPERTQARARQSEKKHPVDTW